MTTVPDNELEVPASSGPSGDFEIREEEETTGPSLGNEVVAVVTPPAGPGPGRNVETGLMDNTIDSGNSAAQLPQKNILERKEVLIGEIRGRGLGGRVWGHRELGCARRGDSPGKGVGITHTHLPELLRGVSQGSPCLRQECCAQFASPEMDFQEKIRILVQRCAVVMAQHPALLPNFQSPKPGWNPK